MKKENCILVEYNFVTDDSGVKHLKYKSITNHKIYEVKAYYDKSSICTYYVRGYSKSEVKKRFKSVMSWMKIDSITETNLKDEDLDLEKCIVF